MKKSLIALAVLAASGAAMAQSTVTLYGVADIWVGSSKLSANVEGESDSVRTTSVDSGGVATSRFGFKGSEDLGGGLKANFQLEQGFNIDSGTQQSAGSAFNRQAWVGLSGGFGEVQLGKVWTSYDDGRSAANDTFGANIASSFNTWAGYTDRTNNGIKYITPNVGGFSGSFTYALGEDKAASENNKASSLTALAAQYAAGPLLVGFAHQTEKDNSENIGLNALPGLVGTAINKLTGDDEAASTLVADFNGKASYNLLNASYDLGVAKLVGGLNQVKLTALGESGSVKANEFNIGVEAPLASNLMLGVGYSQSKVKADGDELFTTKGFSAAVLYSLSKRTTAYAAVTQTKLTAADAIGDASVKSQLFAVGVNHKF